MISVIVPVHNGEKYIEKCLESILKNTYKDLEIIVVENASTDRTLEICREFEKNNKNIRLIVTQEKGLSHARNLGIDNSCGEWIAFVDSDDYVSPYIYEVMAKCAYKSNADFVFCDFIKGVDSNYVFNKPKDYEMRKVLQREFFHDTYMRAQWKYSVAWNKLICKECIGNLRYDEDLRTFEDRDFSIRCVANARNICYINEPLYYYYNANYSSISRSADIYSSMNQVYSLQKEMHFLKEVFPENKEYRDWVCACLLQNADYHYKWAKKENNNLEKQLMSIIKMAERELGWARHIKYKERIKVLLQHYCPELFKIIYNLVK